MLSEIGQQGQKKISDAKILVVGAGGLGCPVLQYLAAAGIGTLRVIDFDYVEESNLQRQILFGTKTIGVNKSIAAKKRLQDLNPTICVEAIPDRLTIKNISQYIEDVDLVVDATDNFNTRYLINDYALVFNKPVVYGAIYKFEGQVSVFNYNSGPSYRCLFPELPNNTNQLNCSEIGVIGVLPGIVGTMMANEVLKIVLGFENILSGILLCYSAKTSETTSLKIIKNQNVINSVINDVRNFQADYDLNSCNNSVKVISLLEALKMHNTQYLDVREIDELPKVVMKDLIQIPLASLEENIDIIDLSKTTIAFCQSGKRSAKAIEILNNKTSNCYSLKEGALALVEQIKTQINDS